MQRTITRGVLLQDGTVGVFTIPADPAPQHHLHAAKMQADDIQLALRNELSPSSAKSDKEPDTSSLHQAARIIRAQGSNR